MDRILDLDEHLIAYPAATFGSSMPSAGILDGDLLIVDRVPESEHMDIVVTGES